MAEIVGVPDGALRAFSQRRAQVLEYLERRGSSGFYAAQVAALETRDRKEPLDLPRLRLEWRARAAEHGLGRRELKRVLDRALVRELDEHAAAEVTAQLVGPDGLTAKRSTFSGPDAVMAWAQAHAQGAPVERVLSLVGRFLGIEPVAPIAPGAVGRPARFSTAELLRHERAALALAARGRQVRVPVVSTATVEEVAHDRGPLLTREQEAMVRAVASSPDRVVCVVGLAGAGKTTALAALADAFRRDGYVAIGAAPPGSPPRISTTRPASPAAPSTGSSPKRDSAEVSLGGACSWSTRQGWPTRARSPACSSRSSTHRGRRSWSAIRPSFPPSARAASSPRSSSATAPSSSIDNRRQRDELERKALALLRAGRSRDYLAHAAERGRLTVAASRTEAKAQLLADWWQPARTDLPGSVMIAYRRADVAELNAVARTLLDREGRLGRDRLRLDNGTEFAAGDRVLCPRNDRRLAVTNGSRGTVHTIDRDRNSIVVELDDNRRLTLPARYLEAGHVSHAYALTGHKTQGLTVERAFVLADDQRALKEWGYVALTRSRHQTRLYTIQTDLQPDAPPHRPEPADPLDRLAAALTRPAAETLALDAATTRHGPPAPGDHARVGRQTRLLADQRRTLEKERTQEARELHRARRELAGLGAIGRARHGRTLREQITEREETLRRFDRELDRTERQLRESRQRALEIARTRTRHRARPDTRAEPRTEHRRERELDL